MDAVKDEKKLQPVRVAHIMGKMMSGGVEAVVMNYYRHIDRTKYQFDFIIDEDSAIVPRDEIESLGGRVFIIAPYQSPLRYQKELTRLLRENCYRIIHCHINAMNFFPLFAAWRAGVPARICHNHSTAHKGEGVRAILKYMLKPFAPILATGYFACGEHAGRWMYGNRRFNAGKVTVINNAIDLRRFAFSQKSRERVRNELGLSGKLVVGHVGRFMYQKNHAFLVDIFREIAAKRPDSALLLIGEGPLRDDIIKKVQALGLEEKVVFLGVTDRPEDYYSAMDAFLLPSFFEGLGMVAVEAQCSGLPVIISQFVPDEVMLTELAVKYDLGSPSLWAEAVLKNENTIRESNTDKLSVAGYDIGKEADRLAYIYSGMIK